MLQHYSVELRVSSFGFNELREVVSFTAHHAISITIDSYTLPFFHCLPMVILKHQQLVTPRGDFSGRPMPPQLHPAAEDSSDRRPLQRSEEVEACSDRVLVLRL